MVHEKLDSLEKIGKLKAEDSTDEEIDGLIRSGHARLADARNKAPQADVFVDEVDRIAKEVGSRKKAFQLTKADWRKAGQGKAMVRFYLPLVADDPGQPVWSVIRKLSDQIGEGVTTHMRAIAKEKPASSRHYRPG